MIYVVVVVGIVFICRWARGRGEPMSNPVKPPPPASGDRTAVSLLVGLSAGGSIVAFVIAQARFRDAYFSRYGPIAKSAKR